MELGWDDITVDKWAEVADPADLIADWLWLVPEDAEPMLATACGDLFLQRSDGRIAVLDTYAGSCATVAPDYEQWKAMLDDPEQLEAWFRGGWIIELLEAGLKREPRHCFSPFVPPIIGGTWRPSNFHACDLLVHLSVLGQIHEQVKDLPPGTPIREFRIVEE